MLKKIVIKGAKEHNLKNISTEILLQGYNSTLTMLGGSNSNNLTSSSSNKNNDFDQTNQQSNSDLDDEVPF